MIADWISRGVSGLIISVPGVGRSNFLSFLCQYPEAIQRHIDSTIPFVLVPVDLNNLPNNHSPVFYRLILRSLYEVRTAFKQTLAKSIATHYEECRHSNDTFLSQSALRELLFHCQNEGIRVVLIFDEFDEFSQETIKQMSKTLRSLRDSFKYTVSYLIGIVQEIIYLPDPDSLGKLRTTLDRNI